MCTVGAEWFQLYAALLVRAEWNKTHKGQLFRRARLYGSQLNTAFNWISRRWEFMTCATSDYSLATSGANSSRALTIILMGWWWRTDSQLCRTLTSNVAAATTAFCPGRWKRHSKIRVIMHVRVSVCYLSPLMLISLSRDVTDGNAMVLFSTHAISLGIMASLFYDVIALIWKAIALESKSNQTGSHSDENELIRKAMCLLKGKKIKTEGGHHATAPGCFQMSLQLIYTQL